MDKMVLAKGPHDSTWTMGLLSTKQLNLGKYKNPFDFSVVDIIKLIIFSDDNLVDDQFIQRPFFIHGNETVTSTYERRRNTKRHASRSFKICSYLIRLKSQSIWKCWLFPPRILLSWSPWKLNSYENGDFAFVSISDHQYEVMYLVT